MTKHLPECPRALHDCERCDRGCFCNELRACEESMNGKLEKFSRDQFDAGYAAALDAAREAVAGLPEVAGWTGELAIIRKPIALDAIDALKEKP